MQPIQAALDGSASVLPDVEGSEQNAEQPQTSEDGGDEQQQPDCEPSAQVTPNSVASLGAEHPNGIEDDSFHPQGEVQAGPQSQVCSNNM